MHCNSRSLPSRTAIRTTYNGGGAGQGEAAAGDGEKAAPAAVPFNAGADQPTPEPKILTPNSHTSNI